MITGRGPGAPGVTPGLDYTGSRRRPAGRGAVAADLGEIRRSEAAIESLAARVAGRPGLFDDPALALLSALSADVDSLSAVPAAHVPDAVPATQVPDAVPAARAADAVAAGTRADPARHRADGWAPGRPPAGPPASQPGHQPARRPARAAGPSSRGLTAWLRAAAAGAVVAGLAGTTSLVAASMLARLTRGTGGRHRIPARGLAARPRRLR